MLLREATSQGDLAMARLLLERGADPDAPEHEPVKNAIRARNQPMLELLLAHGASVRAGAS
jgi:ankyrin repeat protein